MRTAVATTDFPLYNLNVFDDDIDISEVLIRLFRFTVTFSGAEHGGCKSSGNLPSISHSSISRHEGSPHIICYSDEYLKVYFKSSSFSSQDFFISWEERPAMRQL